MVSANEYLESYYPKKGVCRIDDKFNNWGKKRSEITHLDLSRKNLERTLDLLDFINLEEINCGFNQIINLTLPNHNKIKKIYCDFNRLTILDVSSCLELIELRCNHNQLTDLILPIVAKLIELKCYENKLTELILPENNQLRIINVARNLLTDFAYANLNPATLKELKLRNNKLSASNISVLSQLVNLVVLEIGNQNKWVEITGQGNKFYGSLEALKNLTKLTNLNISNTNINQGIEYLPASLKRFLCYSLLNFSFRVKTLEKEIGFWGGDWKSLSCWKKQGIVPQEEDQDSILAIFIESDYKEMEQRKMRDVFSLEAGKLKTQAFFESIQSWDKTGVEPDDRDFVSWPRKIPHLIMNYNEDYQILDERLNEYGLCSDCQQPNTSQSWCQLCNSKRFQNEFANWTSGNQRIDELIKNHQLKATNLWGVLEWIPYDRFTDIEYLAKGGFGKVYKAKWTDGYINNWDNENNKWKRFPRKIILKSLNDSQNMSADFLQEITCHKLVDSKHIASFYGISQDTQTGNYLMIIEYLEGGNLRQYLRDNYGKLDFRDKLYQLKNISEGLDSIHKQKLVHRDFHAGNILNKLSRCFITDLGLSRPVKEEDKEKIYGVLPYVAPEVLQRQPYTQAADIYSFGMIAYEMLTYLPPHYDLPHDQELSNKICWEGLRPKFPEDIKITQLLRELIEKCWDADPDQRPAAGELKEILKNWYQEIDKIDSEKMRSASLIQDKAEGKQMFSLTKDNDELTVRETLLNLNEPNKFLISEASEFYHQYEQIKEFSKPLTSRINNLFLFIFKIHSGAIYTSRLLNRVSLYYPQKPHEEIENFCDDSTEELNKAVEKNPQMIVKKFRHLRSQIKQLKQGKSTTDDQMNLEQKYQKLKKIINSLLEEEQTRTREINALQSQPIITEELCKKLKKQKEEFSYLQKTNRELNEKLSVYENVHEKIKQKKQELKNLNQAIISKYQLDEDDSGEIEELLKAQARNDTKSLERTKKRILKWQTLTEAEIDTLCQVQVEIAKWKLEIQTNFNQINQIFNNYGATFNSSVTIVDNAQLIAGGHNQNISQTNNENTNMEMFRRKKNKDKLSQNNPIESGMEGVEEETSEGSQPSVSVSGDTKTERGNNNLANQAGDKSDFSHRRGDSYGSTINGGILNFGSGSQTLLGGRNENVNQINNSNSKSKLQEIEDEINIKIDRIHNRSEKAKELKKALRQISNKVWDITEEKKIKWQRDDNLDEMINELGQQLGDVSLIKSFCKEKAEEAKRELIVEQLQLQNPK